MKSGTLLDRTQEIPSRLQEEIHKKFPDQDLNELTIRYYESVEDVGYEYFTEKVLPTSDDEAAVRYLEPFISFVCLGEAIILSQEGLIVYDTNDHNRCTETGPFWLVTAK
jgi:hypothetical protein